MVERARWIVAAFAVGVILMAAPAAAQTRVALVLGNSAYARGPIANSLADAGLVAEALNSTGFEIMEGADLNQTDLRRSFADFLARVDAAGPDTIAFIYFSGYALEFEGENYLVPVDAQLAREADIPLEAVRMDDFMRPLAASAARAKVVVLDAARPLPLTIDVAPGLSAVTPPSGTVVALASAPGTFAEDSGQAYGAYAGAIAEMVREPGLDLETIFEGVRMRTHGLTQGRQTPWHVLSLPEEVILVPGDDSGAPSFAAAPVMPRDVRPMRDIDPEEAYSEAVQLDSLPAYVEFVDTYPESIYVPRVWAIIRTRREALVWMRAREFDTREAYWTYLHRYPDGIYASDAQRRLRRFAAFTAPPQGFAPLEFGVPPPLAREPREHAAVYAPLPRLPQGLIAPRPAYLAGLPAPSPRGPRLLPAPVGIPPLPQVGQPPRRVGAPVTVLAPGAVRPDTMPGGAPAQGRFGVGPPPVPQPGPGQPAVTVRPVAPGAATVAPGRFNTVPNIQSNGTPATPRLLAPQAPPQAPPPQVAVPAPTAPTLRMVAPPVVVRPVPPVVHQPAMMGQPQRPAPPPPAPRRCRVLNGVERCG